jgi:hypothetical protein
MFSKKQGWQQDVAFFAVRLIAGIVVCVGIAAPVAEWMREIISHI